MELSGIFGHSAAIKELLVGLGNSPLHVGNWVSEHPKEEHSWGKIERQTKAKQTPDLIAQKVHQRETRVQAFMSALPGF